MKLIITLLILMPVVFYDQVYSQGNKDRNIAVVQAIFEAFNEHNWDKMLSYYSEEAVFVDPSFTNPVSDLKIIAVHYQEMYQLFPDIKDEIISITAASDRVVVEFISTGTAANREKSTLPICTVFTLSNGKVVQDATYYDHSK